MLLEGALQTLKVSFCAYLFGNTIGLVGASMKLSSFSILKGIASTYTTIIKGLPELLTLLLVYFGGSALLSQVLGDYYQVDSFVAGVFSLGIIQGGYSTDIFRRSIQNVDRGAVEAARAYGMGPFKRMTRVELPLAFRHAIPGLSNLWLVLLKESALISVVGLDELMRKTDIAVGATKKPFTFYLICSFIYLLLTYSSELFTNKLNRRAQRGFAV
jgi:polar amino acid transport system permease protein